MFFVLFDFLALNNVNDTQVSEVVVYSVQSSEARGTEAAYT